MGEVAGVVCMLDNIFIVSEQVLVLFILVAIGFCLGKANVLTEKGGKVCTDLALFIATPCVIVNSFQREYSTDGLWELLLALAVALGVHVAAIAVTHVLYRTDNATSRVYRASAVLSNAGFMGLPLQQALFGSQGIMYGATYVVMMNIALWSYGLLVMGRSEGRVSVRKMLISPGTIGLVVGLLLFVCRITLPEVVAAPMKHLGNLNTPLPMLFVGYYLSTVNIKKALTVRGLYGAMAVRLLLVPIVCAALMYACGVRGVMLTSMTVAVAAPTAVSVAMLADRCKQDTETAINLVALSTLISVVTMPLIVSAVQTIA